MKIIHHNEEIDIVALIETMGNKYIDIDMSDYTRFISDANEIHSFTATVSGEGRVKKALETIVSDDGAKEIILNSKSAFIIIVHTLNPDNPLSVSEIQQMSDFTEVYLTDKDILWGITEDVTIGSKVRIILLTK